MWSSRPSELQAATIANQFLVHSNQWFVTCKHKVKTDSRAQKPAEHPAEVWRESQLTPHTVIQRSHHKYFRQKDSAFFPLLHLLHAHGPLASK